MGGGPAKPRLGRPAGFFAVPEGVQRRLSNDHHITGTRTWRDADATEKSPGKRTAKNGFAAHRTGTWREGGKDTRMVFPFTREKPEVWRGQLVANREIQAAQSLCGML